MGKRRVNRGWVILSVMLVQAASAFFFIADILSSFFGIRSTAVSWEARELIEIGAAVGLSLGLVLGGFTLWRTLRERNIAQERLRKASGAFADLLDESFVKWGLTPAEKDVALFAIKGMSTAEIAALRVTSEGTVKAQTNAIYRKAGVTGRSQLLSLFIEDLMRDDGSVRPAKQPQSAA